jgi:ketosteroid isomerase-like protein
MHISFRNLNGVLLAVALIAFAALPARADPNTDAASALNTWWGALVAGTPEALAPVLAPEFQAMRANGSGYDKAGYLASSLPKVAAMPQFAEMTATEQGDHLIIRYFVTVNETRDGKAVQAYAPRLTVFRKEGDRWLVVAHGNFAALEN